MTPIEKLLNDLLQDRHRMDWLEKQWDREHKEAPLKSFREEVDKRIKSVLVAPASVAKTNKKKRRPNKRQEH